MYFKIIPYLFLIFAALFLADAIGRLRNGEDAIISFAFVGVAIFMFFFRRRYYKKFGKDNREEN
jgi:positive regulator of sigma E activity